MLKNNLKIALRNFGKKKIITLITILGLSIGISAAVVIYQIVQYDCSFDKFEPDRNRIYRVVYEGPGWKNSGAPAPLHEALQKGIAGIETTAPFFSYDDWDTKVSIPAGAGLPPAVFKKQKNIVFADSSYFDIFPHRWLSGNAAAALRAPHQLVLSESRARLYFPHTSLDEIIGKRVLFNDSVPTVVSGIVRDLNAPTDFNNKVFISLSTIPASGLKTYFNWGQWNNVNSVSQLFVKLFPGASAERINRQIAAVFKAHSAPDKSGDKSVHRLQALSDVHFNTGFGGTANKSTLFNLILLAVFLLLLGAINFINLSTAQASERAREIGVRKTLGSSKWQLIIQFLTETFLLIFLATIISVLITPVLLNIFPGYIPGGLPYHGIWQPGIFIFLLLLIVVVSLLSGIYPALLLARFNPVRALKNQSASRSGGARSARVRQGLIMMQFVIAQVLIISVLMVNKQIHYSMNKDMGFKKNAIINFYLPFDHFKPDHKKFVLLDKLRSLPGISAVSLGNRPPAFNGQITTVVKYKTGKNLITLRPYMRSGDTSYIRLYHIRLLAGRNVLPADSAMELLVNEALVRRLGFQRPGDALGKFLEFDGRELPIVGVVADFNEASMRTPIRPLIYFSARQRGYVMHVALQHSMQSWKSTITQIGAAWKVVYPDKDFEYTFLDKTIAAFYKQDVKVSRLLAWSAGIAILIGCLGLLGLVIFTAHQRTREIGIRKVLGASVTQIISLLSKDFIKLVALAFVVAVPIAWIILYRWLQHFAYHTRISWWLFVASGLMMGVIALVILSIRAAKAAMANPVKSLRTE